MTVTFICQLERNTEFSGIWSTFFLCVFWRCYWITLTFFFLICIFLACYYLYLYLVVFFLFYFIFKLYNIVLVFSKYRNESATGIHVFPILNPPPSPYHPFGSSQCTSPKHPVLCIEPGLVTHFVHDIIHVSMPFSQIIPPSPSPTESIRLFYTSVSLLLSHTQGYCYHLSKFHIYALVYCSSVFLSGLLHSV